MHLRRGALALLLVGALVLTTGCTGPTEDSSVASAATAAAPNPAPLALVQQLAEAGVATLDDIKGEPLAPLAEPASALVLSEGDVAILAGDGTSAVGITGAQLDESVDPTTLVDGADPLPASLWLVAWALAADTPASRMAQRLLGDQDWAAYQDVVIPTAVLFLFAADAAPADAESAAAAAGAAFIAPAALVPAVIAPAAFVPAAQTSVCEAALAFVDSAINTFFTALGRASYVGYSGSTVNRILIFIRNLGASVINFGIDAIREVVKDGVRITLAPVLSIIARIASVTAVAGYVVNSVRPWSGTFLPEPRVVQRSAEATPGMVTVTATTLGPTSWPDHIEGCAQAADVTLPSLKPTGASVTWTVTRQLPVEMVVDEGGDDRLDEQGRAVWEFETLPEDPETAEGETLYDGAVYLTAVIRRDDLDKLQALITSEVLGVIPQPFAGYVTPILGPLLDAQLTRLRETLMDLHDVTLRSFVAVNYHRPDPDEPDPPGVRATIPTVCPPAAVIGSAWGPDPGPVPTPGVCYYGPVDGLDFADNVLVLSGEGACTAEPANVPFDGEPIEFAGADWATLAPPDGYHAFSITVCSDDRWLHYDVTGSEASARAVAQAIIDTAP